MNALLLDRLPLDINAAKDRDPAGNYVLGERVHDAALVSALLQYGSYDRYFYLAHGPGGEAGRPRDDRLVPVTDEGLDILTTADRLVLFTSSLVLPKYLPLRAWYQRHDWAICGLTSTLSSTFELMSCMALGAAAVAAHDAIICSTVAAQKTMRGIFNGLLHSASIRPGALAMPEAMFPVIPMGVSAPAAVTGDRAALRQELGLPADAVVYLFLGRLSIANKLDFRPLLSTFLSDPELPAGSVLVLAGDDTQFHLSEHLQAFVRACPGRHHVIVKPNVTTAAKAALLRSADVFVALSDTFEETFGISVVEAMMAGLPVIAADWNGYRDLIDDGLTGLLVPTSMHDTSEGLSMLLTLFPDARERHVQRVCIDLPVLREALRALGHDPVRRRALGEAARAKAERTYSWPVIVRQYEALWREQTARGREAALRREGVASVRHGAPAAYYDYAVAFGHYPTRLLSDATRVQRASDRRPLPPTLSLDAVDEQILRQLESGEAMTMGDLVQACAGNGRTATVIRSRTSRFLKHGVLDLCDPVIERRMAASGGRA
jgi:glycosyltransferase involved in cell wall biosynthesis